MVGAAAMTALGMPAHAEGKVALTFDDLPGLTILQDQPYIDHLTRKLLHKLRRHHFPATGFVNEDKLEQDPARQTENLRRWLRAGMDLGNHTYSHESLTQIGATAYISNIVKGEPVTKALLTERGLRMKWFRHPYLDTGFPDAVRRQVDTWLDAHGYRVAPVTIDADDWEFAEPYDDAIAHHDRPLQRRIRKEYVAYTAIRIAWSQESAKTLFDRDIAHVMLLHGTRLNADTLDDLAKLLEQARLKPIGLSDALRDPAYRTPDDYTGKDGINWLGRWSMSLHRTLPSTGDVDPPKDIQELYDRVDDDRGK